jgi:hypothetical protein
MVRMSGREKLFISWPGSKKEGKEGAGIPFKYILQVTKDLPLGSTS